MASAGKTQITVNTTTPSDGDAIAAYLADGSGNFLTSQVIASIRRLDVNLASEYAEDSAHSNGHYGTFVMAVRSDSGAAFGADGDYVPFSVDASNRLRVIADLTTAFDFAHVEDDAASSGFTGAGVLGVRRDSAGAATAGTDGDFSELQTWSNGELKTVDIVNGSNLQQVVTVGTVAAALPTAALARRKLLFIQNISTLNNLFVGSATVTNSGATRGLRLGPGGFVSVEAGPGNVIYGVGSAASTDAVVWEHS